MIDLYYMPSPNTWKVSVMLEECGLPYTVRPVDIMAGESREPEFLKINPNGRIPAIIDREGPGGAPFAVFESGAILLYLAEKTGQFLSTDPRVRSETLQWLFWQVGGLGPMAGQAHVFRNRNDPHEHYAIDRYTQEAARLYGVMERRLSERDYLAGDYSIADIACWSWVFFHEMHGQALADFPAVARWFGAIGQRLAVKRGRLVGIELVSEDFQRSLRQSHWTKS